MKSPYSLRIPAALENIWLVLKGQWETHVPPIKKVEKSKSHYARIMVDKGFIKRIFCPGLDMYFEKARVFFTFFSTYSKENEDNVEPIKTYG